MLARRIINRARDLLFLPAFDGLWRFRARGRIAVLLYHRVDEPGHSSIDAFGVPPIAPSRLRAELQFLRSQGARFLSLEDLRRAPVLEPHEFGIAITFDDGFRSNYTTGMEVLDDVGVPACIFQCSAMVDGPALIWEHALYHRWADPRARDLVRRLVTRRRASWSHHADKELLDAIVGAMPATETEDILAEAAHELGDMDRLQAAAQELYPSSHHLRAAVAAGHEVGSHGHRHYPRRNIDAPTFAGELETSARILASVLGAPPRSFSYPFNSYLDGDHDLAFRTYEDVFTVDASPLRLPRPAREPQARYTWPGPHRNALRRRRWLWSFAESAVRR